jgi:hypothetical protein
VHRLPVAPQVPRGLLSRQHEPSITDLSAGICTAGAA